MSDYDWGGFSPYQHQSRIFYETRDERVHALLMEMRTGKTPIIIHNAAYLYERGEIDGLLVMCPNYVKAVWDEQFIEHAPAWLDYDLIVWEPRAPVEREVREMVHPDDRLNVLVMNEEAFSTERGQEIARHFLGAHIAMWAIDEATSIKSPRAKRSKAVQKIRDLAKYRRILTGTPITKGPLDLWGPFAFLDKKILGTKSWYGFRARHAVMGGYRGKQILQYVALDEVRKKIEPYSTRLLARDVKDMPPRVYQKIPVELNKQQRKIYDQMKAEMVAEWSTKTEEERRLEVNSLLVQLLRLAQITGGFVPSLESDEPEPVPGKNPKLEALLRIAADSSEPIVIFSRFRAEIAAISAALRKDHGDESVVEFHGGISTEQKKWNRNAFKSLDPDNPIRFFVANQTSARMGIDLSRASFVVYFTNSHDLLDRVQTEARTETLLRTKGSTQYVDLVATDTVDLAVIESLRNKQKLSDLITGDRPLGDWI